MTEEPWAEAWAIAVENADGAWCDRQSFRLGYEAGQQSIADAISRTGDTLMAICRGGEADG